MRVNVVRDENGKVVATFQHTEGGPSVAPVLKPDHTIHEVEAAKNYYTDIKAFYKEHSR